MDLFQLFGDVDLLGAPAQALAALDAQGGNARGVSPEAVAKTVVFLATASSVGDSAEVYWKACRPKTPSAYAQRGDEAARLWELSARLCGVGRAAAA